MADNTMRIYISGPITGTDDYMERFERAETSLELAGYTVINPAAVNSMLPADTTHEHYMRTSIAMLSMCDAIYMMSGWKNSKGCAEEIQWAINNQLTCIFEEKMNIKMPEERVPRILERLSGEICDNLCKYADTSDENCECQYIKEHGHCPLDILT